MKYQYRGYIGSAVYDDEIGMFAGSITNAVAIGTFYSETIEELEKEFRTTVDEYFAVCKEHGIEPRKPYDKQ